FFGTALITSFVVGAIGLMLVVHGWPVRLWALFGLSLVLWFSFRKGDIYTALSIPVTAVVPWLLYLLRRNSSGVGMGVFLVGSGLVAGFANQIRGQAATGLLIFAAVLIAFQLKRTLGRKL